MNRHQIEYLLDDTDKTSSSLSDFDDTDEDQDWQSDNDVAMKSRFSNCVVIVFIHCSIQFMQG